MSNIIGILDFVDVTTFGHCPGTKKTSKNQHHTYHINLNKDYTMLNVKHNNNI